MGRNHHLLLASLYRHRAETSDNRRVLNREDLHWNHLLAVHLCICAEIEGVCETVSSAIL